MDPICNIAYAGPMVTLRREAIYIPSATVSDGTVILSKRIAGIHLLPQKEGGAKLGSIAQLDPAPVEVCGTGFNERTVKVRLNGEYYFVFREDLN
jgi:hypothetical protein